jgi:hypothetical protein
MPLGDRTERRPGLDRLQLLRIADQHHLGPGPFRRRQYPLQLARADHAGLVDHQHIARPQSLAALPPLIFHAGDRPRGDARSPFQILRRDPRQRCTAHL